MEYMSTKEAAVKWKVSVRYVQKLLSEARIEGAKRYGRYWMIPANTEKPKDPRINKDKIAGAMKHLLPRKMPGLIMSTLYYQPGSAKEVLKNLKGNSDAYYLFKSELLYLQGEFEKSREILQSLIENTKCFDTRLGCLVGIMHTCLYIGDYTIWNKSRTEILNTPYTNEQEKAEIEMCIVATDSALYDNSNCPNWLRDGKLEHIPFDCFPSARFYLLKNMIIDHTKIEQMEILNLLCSQTMVEGAIVAELYQRLLAAAVYHVYNRKEDCIENIKRAFDIALPDKLYAPLAESRKEIGYLIDKMLRERDMTAYKEVERLWKQLEPSWRSLYQMRFRKPLLNNLTLREDEVMKYAAMNMTNDEIAKAMDLSVGTIKNYISSILQKTGLHDRRQFTQYLT